MTTQTFNPPSPRSHDALLHVAGDVAGLRSGIVNVFFIGRPGAQDWVLIDAGLYMSAGMIMRAAEQRFGTSARPRAIILTHGHFDHRGALETLAETWDVPVYAHSQEMAYLTGESDYPPPDPTVGGGAMTRLSPLYPRGPINISHRLRALPEDGTVPDMPGWLWVHTPGHTPGHVSLFRESDRTLIVGDAFCTTRQESLLDAITQRYEIHGPPAYFTTDWDAARSSVQRLEALRPVVAAPSHGRPVFGTRLAHDLHRLARDFNQVAVPRDGRYVRSPAVTDERGAVVKVPPAVSDALPKVMAAVALGAAVTAAVVALRRRDQHWRT